MNRRTRGRFAIVALAAVLSLSACGTRVDHEAVVAGAGASTVSLDPASIAALKSAAGPAAPPANENTAEAATATTTAAQAPSTPATASAAAAAAPVAQPAAANRPATTKAKPPATAAQAGAAQAAPAQAGAGRPTAAKPPAGAPAAPATGARADALCTTPGAPLKLGQIGSFSGVAGPITANARTAMAAWAQAVNARGGIACHPVVLYTADDGADPAKAASLVQDLIENKGVQAFVGVFDAIGFPGIASAVEKVKVPVIGGDGIDFSWNENPYLFPAGAGLLGDIRGSLAQTIGSGKTNLGLLYCVEASVCTNVSKTLQDEVKKTTARLTYTSAISLTQPDFTAQCQNAKNAGVQAMGMAMDGASIGRVARSCAAIDYHPQFVTNGLVLSPQNAADPDIRRNTLSSASSVAPWMLDDTPGQREFHAAMGRYAPALTPDADSITAWAAGRLLEAVVHGLGAKARTAPVTTADLFTGLATIHDETLDGLTPPMTFTAGQKSAPLIGCVYFELLSDKGWTALDSKPKCR